MFKGLLHVVDQAKPRRTSGLTKGRAKTFQSQGGMSGTSDSHKTHSATKCGPDVADHKL